MQRLFAAVEKTVAAYTAGRRQSKTICVFFDQRNLTCQVRQRRCKLFLWLRCPFGYYAVGGPMNMPTEGITSTCVFHQSAAVVQFHSVHTRKYVFLTVWRNWSGVWGEESALLHQEAARNDDQLAEGTVHIPEFLLQMFYTSCCGCGCGCGCGFGCRRRHRDGRRVLTCRDLIFTSMKALQQLCDHLVRDMLDLMPMPCSTHNCGVWFIQCVLRTALNPATKSIGGQDTN